MTTTDWEEPDSEEEEETPEPPKVVQIGSKDLKDLRRAAKEGRKAKTELEEFRREQAFGDARLKDLNESQRKALLAIHEGQHSADSYFETATALGFGPKENSEVLEQERAIATATAGAKPASAASVSDLSPKEALEKYKVGEWTEAEYTAHVRRKHGG